MGLPQGTRRALRVSRFDGVVSVVELDVESVFNTVCEIG
jgi:hypothetical protein